MTMISSQSVVSTSHRTVKILAHNIAAHFDARFTSWWLGTAMFAIGMVLTFNPTALTATPNAPIYFARMMAWGDQGFWRIVFTSIGTARIATLVINGSFPGIGWMPNLRMAMSGLSCIIWLQIAVSVAIVSNPTIGAVMYSWVLWMEMRDCRRDLREARLEPRGGNGGRDS